MRQFGASGTDGVIRFLFIRFCHNIITFYSLIEKGSPNISVCIRFLVASVFSGKRAVFIALAAVPSMTALGIRTLNRKPEELPGVIRNTKKYKNLLSENDEEIVEKIINFPFFYFKFAIKVQE